VRGENQPEGICK